MIINEESIKEIFRIRIVEEKFLDLFSLRKVNGTVHTCIGQELSALSFCSQLNTNDFVFSNHRCHGHYISYTKDWKGLIRELLGKKKGVSKGIGSSQHLQKNNFFSNGIQGGIVPLSAGFALGNKLKNNNNIGVTFIGDGTLGEGAVYEAFNFISLKEIPILIVCENNRYAQSTSIEDNLAGDILNRAKAFGLETRESTTNYLESNIFEEAKSSLDYVRSTGKPLFHLVNTNRLKAHSKGDDDRDLTFIKEIEKIDYINNLLFENKNKKLYDKIQKEVDEFVDVVLKEEELSIEEYEKLDQEIDYNKINQKLIYNEAILSKNTLIKDFQKTFSDLIKDDKTVLIGEDIKDPYGGAFKVTKGLSSLFPKKVISTQIAELLIGGVSNGLALNGFKPIAEFMFGDFTALAFDQLLNHASKFRMMYANQVNCPVIFRTPMGGGRGYGPTHSQSIEKHFIGMKDFEILCVNKIVGPKIIYDYSFKRNNPTLIIENKTDYALKPNYNIPKSYKIELSNEDLPNVRLVPKNILNPPNLAFICYGENYEKIINKIEEIIVEKDIIPSILILTKIDPLPLDFLLENIKSVDNVITIEEGSERGGVGDNIISLLAQHYPNKVYKTVSSANTIIPSVKSLEEYYLLNTKKIIEKI